MSHQVQIQRREAQSYAAISMRVTMDTLSGAVDQAFPELFGWLAEHAAAPAGPPLIRYLVADMAAGLQIDLGVPVGTEIGGSDRIRSGILPAGRYVVLRHVGPYDGLIATWPAQQRHERMFWGTLVRNRPTDRRAGISTGHARCPSGGDLNATRPTESHRPLQVMRPPRSRATGRAPLTPRPTGRPRPCPRVPRHWPAGPPAGGT